MPHNPFETILEFIAKDQVEPVILGQNDYLRLENKILKEQLSSGNKKLNDHQRKTLAELGHKIREINRQIFEESITAHSDR
jgi:regulator of replication initiation timing